MCAGQQLQLLGRQGKVHIANSAVYADASAAFVGGGVALLRLRAWFLHMPGASLGHS